MDSLRKKTSRGLFWNILDKVINQAGQFFLLIYLSRVLSPSDFGLIAMLAIFLMVAQVLIDSGFSQALIQKNQSATEVDLSTVFYLNLLVSSIVYCCLYFSAPSIALFYNRIELVDVSRLIFIVVIINSFSLVPRATLSISLDFKTQSVINSIATLVSAGVAITIVNYGHGYWSLVGLNIAKSLVASLLLITYSKWYPKWLFSFESCKNLFSFGSNLLIAGVLAAAAQNLYSLLIGRFYNATQLGFFHQSFQYSNILSNTLTSAIQGVTFPVMSSVQKDEKRLVNIYRRLTGVVALISIPTFVGFAAISEEFVLIFLGSQWVPMVSVLFILSLARAFTPMSALNLNILNAMGRSDLFLKVDLIKLPISLIALAIAIPFGIIAVALSQLFFAAVSFFVNTYYSGKLFGFGAKEQLKQIIPIGIASLLMYLSIIFIKIDSMEIQLVTKVGVGLIVYLSVCFVLKISAFVEVLNIILRRSK